MCGISGIFSLNGKPVNGARARIEKMTNALIHRGPDSQGSIVTSDGLLALGNTRLAIVAPNVPIIGPMQSPDKKHHLSFNGEIYNYREVLSYLKSKDVSFRTNSDTEVLLHGFQKEGIEFLKRCDGMWVFAFYDESEKLLHLVRDVMGERHLFYYQTKDEFIFASEPLAILKALPPDIDLKIDFDSFITTVMQFSAPPGKTLIQNMNRMLPGRHCILKPNTEPKMLRYARLHPEKWTDHFKSDASIESGMRLFEEIYYKTCKLRLPDEVPYICTLSGGIDSTLTCLYASNFGKTRIHTLYGQSSDQIPQNLPTDLNELEASLLTAAKLKTDHHQILLHSKDATPVLRQIARNAFDGMYDSGTASFEMLARFANVMKNKVMLIADGPDEILGGYKTDQRAFQQGLASGAKPSAPNDFHFNPIHTSWTRPELTWIFSENQMQSAIKQYGTFDFDYLELKGLDDSQMRAISYASYSLPDMFNLRTDKAYLHSSVEARVPYQAPGLMELMIAMPSTFRFNDGTSTKYILRQLVDKNLGPQISRRSKHGFSAPIWKSEHAEKELRYKEQVASSSLFKNFPFAASARGFLLNDSNHDFLWPFYVFSTLAEQVLNRDF